MMATKMDLNSLDQWQGNDPEILAVREKIGEPSTYKYDSLFTLLPTDPAKFAWNCSNPVLDFSVPDRVEFTKVRIHGDGVIFDAWQCKRDGKVYF